MLLRQLFLCVIILSVFSGYGVIDRHGDMDGDFPFQQVIENDEDPNDAIARDESIIRSLISSNEYILNARLRLIVNYTNRRDSRYDARIMQLCNDVLNTNNAPYILAYYHLGEIHFRNGNPVLALENYQTALEQDINFMIDPGPCSYRGFAQMRINQIEAILEDNVLPQ